MKHLVSTCILLTLSGGAEAQAPASRSEAEFLVPPQGGAFEISVRPGEVCILSFPERLAKTALVSSPDYEIKAWGDDGVAVRPMHEKVNVSTLALATASGQIKVNVTLRVVPRTEPALTLVRFKAASAEEAFEAAVASEVKKRVAPLEAELAKVRKDLDERVRSQADGLLAERLLSRDEIVRLESHERNNDHVIVHVLRGRLLGDDGYIVFEIENRSRSAYRVSSVRVLDGRRDVAGPARLVSSAIDRDPSVLGVVASGASARGIVTVRSAGNILGRPLALEIAAPKEQGKIRLDRGITLK